MKRLKRFLAQVVLTALLCTSVFGNVLTGFAEETAFSVEAIGAAEETVDVYLTVVNRGVIATASDATPMARKKVTVKDLNGDGSFSYDEALTAAHETWCTQGTGGYSAPGGFVYKLWNIENSYGFYFYNNDLAIPNGVSVDHVKDGDELAAAILTDTVYWSDWFVTFTEKELEAKAGSVFMVELKGHALFDTEMVPVKDLKISIRKNGNSFGYGGSTDEKGQASVCINQAGTYLLSAEGTVSGAPIIAPFCTVTVTGTAPVPESGSGAGTAVKRDDSVKGSWTQAADGTWSFKDNSGKEYKNEWGYINNPYSADADKGGWYRFNAAGKMITGWFTDTDGSVYYMNPVSDGSLGKMLTGWQLINGKWYYFNPVSNGKKGAMLKNTTTPDGYQVGADGVWNR